MAVVPRTLFRTKGVGRHREELHSFELALRDAGIEKCNLVRVSSIMPPGSIFISRRAGVTGMHPGALTYCVMSRCYSNEPGPLLAASVGCAVPAEHHPIRHREEQRLHDGHRRGGVCVLTNQSSCAVGRGRNRTPSHRQPKFRHRWGSRRPAMTSVSFRDIRVHEGRRRSPNPSGSRPAIPVPPFSHPRNSLSALGSRNRSAHSRPPVPCFLPASS